MELYNIKYVLAVADLGSFSKAARSCHVGQPALSQQVSRLEEELGVALFVRRAHGVELTQAGQEFVRRGRELVRGADALQAAMARFAGVRAGELDIGIITSLECMDFAGMLSGFCGTYPDITINITEAGSYDLLAMLQDRRLDVAFINKPLRSLPPAVDSIKLGEENYSLAVPRLHRLAKAGRVRLEQVRDEDFIFHNDGQVAAELCMEACREAGFVPHIVCRSANPTTDLYMVRGGLGITFLPDEEFLNRRMPDVVQVKLEKPIRKEVLMAWRRDADSPLVDAMVQFATSWRLPRIL